MVFMVPQFEVSFDIKAGDGPRHQHWIVNGEAEIEVLCKILRWNGIKEYAVKPLDPPAEDAA